MKLNAGVQIESIAGLQVPETYIPAQPFSPNLERGQRVKKNMKLMEIVKVAYMLMSNAPLKISVLLGLEQR